MAFAGAMRERVRFERRVTSVDGYGNEQGAWSPLLTVWAKVAPKPTGRGEEVQAGRLAGAALYSVIVRSSAASRGVAAGDRAVIVNSGSLPSGAVLNVRFVGDMDARKDVLTLDAEIGVAT